jgi:hypothetical protein
MKTTYGMFVHKLVSMYFLKRFIVYIKTFRSISSSSTIVRKKVLAQLAKLILLGWSHSLGFDPGTLQCLCVCVREI